MKIAFILAALISLSACMSKEERIAHDVSSMDKPRLVGVLPNGQNLHRIILRDTPNGETHFVYYTDTATTINESVTKTAGKTQSTHQFVYVHINGQDVPIEEVKAALEKAERD